MIHDDYLDDERMGLLKVVEYLEPTMAKELLCKFPDNSAFDFDYTQSSIWSPVTHRAFRSLPPLEIKRVLDFKLNEVHESKKITKKTPSTQLLRTLKIFSKTSFNLSFVNKNKMASVPSTVSLPRQPDAGAKCSKGWEGVLKAATKHFKRRKRKEQMVRVKVCHQDKDWDPLLASLS